MSMPAEVETARRAALTQEAADDSQLQPQLAPFTPDSEPVPATKPGQPQRKMSAKARIKQREYNEAYRQRQKLKRLAESGLLPEKKSDPNHASLLKRRRQEREAVALMEPIASAPASTRFIVPPPFDWMEAPLPECSRRLKWLQDESAAGLAALATRQPREEHFRCWCSMEHAREQPGNKRPPCYSPSHEKMGPDQPIARPVSIQTVRVRDFPGGPEKLVNLYFATPGCLAQYQKKVYGLHEPPLITGR